MCADQGEAGPAVDIACRNSLVRISSGSWTLKSQPNCEVPSKEFNLLETFYWKDPAWVRLPAREDLEIVIPETRVNDLLCVAKKKNPTPSQKKKRGSKLKTVSSKTKDAE